MPRTVLFPCCYGVCHGVFSSSEPRHPVGCECWCGCGGELVLRNDDKPETAQKRLDVYHEQTQPLIDYYQTQNILKEVDGTLPMEEVFQAIIAILED